MGTLANKCVVLGVSGGIAAYKSAELVRLLVKAGADVHVIMTKAATEFITPLTLQTLSMNAVHIDQFRLVEHSEIGHISLADRADLILVAPATANVMAKVANGIADDLLTTTIMASKAKILFAPGMNTNMWNSPATQENLAKLERYGYHLVDPASGELACGVWGKGRLAALEDIMHAVHYHTYDKPLAGKKLVVTAGPTREHIDPVRYISNRSSGKMGYALAFAANILGADVTLVSGPATATIPQCAAHIIHVESAAEMLDATDSAFKDADALVMCAAVADFRPEKCATQKAGKECFDRDIPFEQNPDIVATVAKAKGDRLVVGFAAETEELLAKAQKKMARKHLDYVVANDVSRTDVGFESDANEVRILGKDGTDRVFPMKSKTELAFDILRYVFRINENQ